MNTGDFPWLCKRLPGRVAVKSALQVGLNVNQYHPQPS